MAGLGVGTYATGNIPVYSLFEPVFDGTYYLENSSPINLPIDDTARSIFGWIKVPQPTTAQVIFGYGGTDVDDPHYQAEFTYNSRHRELGYYWNQSYSATNEYGDSNFILAANTWYFIGMSYPANGYVDFYVFVNGKHSKKTINVTGFSTRGEKICVGLGTSHLKTYENIFIGNIEKVGIWSRALTNDEVVDYYNAGRVNYESLPDELKDIPTLNVVNAQARFLNLANFQARTIAIQDLQATSAGGFYQAARFNGGSQIVINSAPTNVVSVSVWAKYDAVNSNGPIIVKGSNAWNSALWDWGIWADNNNFYAVVQPGGSFCNLSHDNTSWYHIVLVRDNGSGNGFIYLNGNLAASTTSGSTNSQANTIYIGGVDSSQYIPGAIGEIQLFDYALSSPEVFNMYNYGNGVYGSVYDVGLIAGYHLNNDLIDYKSGNHGTWGGAPAFTTGSISTIPLQSANLTGSNRIAISLASDIVAISVWVNFSSSSSFGPVISNSICCGFRSCNSICYQEKFVIIFKKEFNEDN